MTLDAPDIVLPAAAGTATRHLHALIQSRDALRPAFENTRDHLAASRDAGDIDAWSAGALALLNVNAGASCLIAYFKIGKALSPGHDIAPMIAAANAATDICRHAGARAATACLDASATVRRLLMMASHDQRWWRAMINLAALAPESVEIVASQTGVLLATADIATFENFIAAGLKHGAADTRKRRAFFALEDAAARKLLNRASSQIGFAETERATKAFVTALWGTPALLRSLPIDDAHAPQRRAAIAGQLIRLPELYRGIADDAAPALYRAAAAHAQAHLVLGGPRFVVGKLKPLQVALVGLIEDARIEALAMRRFPGLYRLWSPYHVARPSGVATAPILMARLSRALFDPSYADDDGFVAKGRRMFAGAGARLGDPAISREIGMLLGNDLGQMRVQFNPKTYVVEPIYRDDGMGLWDFGDDADASADVLELFTDAMRTEGQAKQDAVDADGETGRAKPTAPTDRGVVIASYPEWDRAHGVERPDWTTVREVAAKSGNPASIDDALESADALRGRIRRLVGSLRVGRTTRLKRQFDGHDLDIDAMLDAGIALATGQEPDPRVFRATTTQHRDLAVLVLIDISESTRDRLTSGASILDVEQLAVAVLAEAMSAVGDPFCLLAFASNGRDDVQMTAVKQFGEPYDRASMARLAGLSPGLSTRLGTALRHAGATIGTARSFRKLVIVLTDGEPSDVDVVDPQELVEDARRAALGLKARGIDGFGVLLDPGGMSAAGRIFGRGNTMLVHRVEDLPRRLSELYFRLARR